VRRFAVVFLVAVIGAAPDLTEVAKPYPSSVVILEHTPMEHALSISTLGGFIWALAYQLPKARRDRDGFGVACSLRWPWWRSSASMP
jgi:hypothetical protein